MAKTQLEYQLEHDQRKRDNGLVSVKLWIPAEKREWFLDKAAKSRKSHGK